MIHSIGRLQGVMAAGPAFAKRDRPAATEHRKIRRTRALLWAAIVRATGWTGRAVVVDISPGGMCIRCTMKAETGMQVVIELPGVTPLRGYVRWAGTDRFGVALESEIDVDVVIRTHAQASSKLAGVDTSV